MVRLPATHGCHMLTIPRFFEALGYFSSSQGSFPLAAFLVLSLAWTMRKRVLPDDKTYDIPLLEASDCEVEDPRLPVEQPLLPMENPESPLSYLRHLRSGGNIDFGDLGERQWKHVEK